jgi:hypothetical protein
MRRGRSPLVAAGCVAVVLLVLLLGVFPNLGPSLSVSYSISPAAGGQTAVGVDLTNHRAYSLPVTASVFPGVANWSTGRPIYLYVDPRSSCVFGDEFDVQGQALRLLQLPGISVHAVNASGVLRVLAGTPDAILMLLECGVVPAAPSDPTASALHHWLLDGGELIWAGGPIGFYVQTVSFPQYGLVDRGWSGQQDILGFPLVDTPAGAHGAPIALPGGTTATTPSAMANALGTSYADVPYGANTSELGSHYGVDLGFDAPAVGNAAPRSSLSFVPVGSGGVYYFGGALWIYNGAALPNAGTTLGFDLSVLLRMDALPVLGPVDSESVSVAPYSSASLNLAFSPGVTGEVLVVRTQTAWVPMTLSLYSLGP